MRPDISFEEAVAAFGSQSSLARALGVSRQSVSDWKAAGEIPTGRQWQLLAQHPGRFARQVTSAATAEAA